MNLKLCASPAYLRDAPRLKSPDDLAHHKLMMLPSHLKVKFAQSALKLGDFYDKVSLHCKSGSFLTEMALEGHGIAVRADWDVASQIKSGNLVEVLPKWPLAPYGHVFVAVPTRKLLAPRVRFFLDFLKEKFSV
jgi:DNA-binding transcriptional LysR family regulator